MTLVSEDHCPLRTGANPRTQEAALRAPAAASEPQQTCPPQPGSRPAISVVVVTWNAKKYVDQCLRSLYEDDVIPVEVIVVDNASTDGSPDLLAREFPSFRVLRNPQNLGFARANNIGIRESHGEYVCLVNSDVVLSRGLFTLFTSSCNPIPTSRLRVRRCVGPMARCAAPACVIPRFSTRWPGHLRLTTSVSCRGASVAK